jgi:protein-disulfide isomerase
MRAGKSWILAGVLGVLIGGGAVALSPIGRGSDRTENEVERIVKTYLLEHPEIIPEALTRLQEREHAKAVDANRAAYETPFGSAWAGAEDGDVVLVEFFDYACVFCRKSNADIERLLAEDDKLKVVWRELPVLGPDSQAAAEASLAAAAEGKFRPFYDKLFALGRPTPAAVADARQAAGIAPGAASPAHRDELQKNFELARAINASGTPVFVVGDHVLQGAVGYEALKEAVAKARAS